jgi:myo-inositol-1(or 4)-monophosphatase
MTSAELRRAQAAAVDAAQAAGALMRRHLRRTKKVNEAHQHDIKLELDVRAQRLITRRLARAFPSIPVLGEEGVDAKAEAAPARWVVDPIDGTVNFAYGIPHACVSIALQTRTGRRGTRRGFPDDDFESQVGVVLDPFNHELFTAIRGQTARLNGRPIHPSRRKRLDEAVVTLGFAKSKASLEVMMPAFVELVHRVRKIRIMGSAALALVYVADGRFDAYLEAGVRLWDIAAGGLILECAGGDFLRRRRTADHVYALLASNGPLRRRLERVGGGRYLAREE